MKKKGPAPKLGLRKGKRTSRDPFFSTESKKQRKIENDGDVIDSGESEEDYGLVGSDRDEGENGVEEKEDEFVDETADEKRHRVARAYLEKVREIAAKEEEDNEGGGGRESEKEGERDSLVARILQQEQLEETGRVRRAIASRYCAV